ARRDPLPLFLRVDSDSSHEPHLVPRIEADLDARRAARAALTLPRHDEERRGQAAAELAMHVAIGEQLRRQHNGHEASALGSERRLPGGECERENQYPHAYPTPTRNVPQWLRRTQLAEACSVSSLFGLTPKAAAPSRTLR